MTEAEARDLLVQMLVDWRECHEVAIAATRNARGIERVVSGYLLMYPNLVTEFEIPFDLDELAAPGADAPKGAEAVRIILQETAGEWFLVSELVTELRQRGWLPESDNPANAVRAALERLVKQASETDVRKGQDEDGKVIYCYDPDRTLPFPGYDDEEPF